MLHIVSILSDQPVPNLRLIKHFGGEGVRHIFLSTTKIEEAGIDENLRLAARIEQGSLTKRVIDPANPALIAAQLASFQFDRKATYLVNVTGGTKMMSQSVTVHFMNGYPDCRIVYLDINTGQLAEIYPDPGLSMLSGKGSLDLAAYFTVHGFTWTREEYLYKSPIQTRQLMSKVISKGGLSGMPKLRPPYERHPDLMDRKYYSGGWFEEWSWYAIKEALRLGDKDIMHSIKLYARNSRKLDADHELDVAFVYRGKLHVAECKAFTKYEGEKFNKTAFKLPGITRNLGQACVSLICLCVEIPENAIPHIEDLSKAVRVRGVLSWPEISCQNTFSDKLNQFVNKYAP